MDATIKSTLSDFMTLWHGVNSPGEVGSFVNKERLGSDGASYKMLAITCTAPKP